MIKLVSVFWRDIPAQVIGKVGRQTVKKVLPPRFAEAIDTAAMRAGRGRSDLYLSDWRRETRMCEGDLEQIVSEEAARLEGMFPPRELDRVIQANGLLSPRQPDPKGDA